MTERYLHALEDGLSGRCRARRGPHLHRRNGAL